MNIYIDESGSYVCAPHKDAWNVVVAYVSPEIDNRRLKRLIKQLKRKCGVEYKNELKLRDLSEDRYIWFLENLIKLNGVLFCTATDTSMLSNEEIIIHRNNQAERILENYDKMKYEEGKHALRYLHDQVKSLSPQLYLQLTCQVNLIIDIIYRAILFYVQRIPKTLEVFKWRIDQKNTSRIDFEDSFEKVCPMFLQTYSLTNPIPLCEDFDYSFMDKYFFTKDTIPRYLNTVYGIETDLSSGINIQKIVREDISFVDSKENIGIQVGDLLATGIRRALRVQFSNLEKITILLGCLMLQAQKEKWPINLISYVNGRIENSETKQVINNMKRYSKPMFT